MLNRFRAAWRSFTRAQRPMTRTGNPEFYSVDWDVDAFAAFGIYLTEQQRQVLIHLPFRLQIELVRTGELSRIGDQLRDIKPYAEDLEALRDIAANTSEFTEIRQALERLASVVKGSPGVEEVRVKVTNPPASELGEIRNALNKVAAQGNGRP